ncbi:hypothetical protein ACQQ4G_003146 [Listeria monocytogenes]
MKGILFDNLHSFDDFALILKSKTIGQPKVKTEYIEVLGADGQLDFTEAFGDVFFDNRTHSFVFSTIESGQSWAALYTKVLNALHGRKMKITLDDDPEYYYLGRINVSEYASSKRIGTITIDVDAEPFKYKKNKTIISSVVNGSLTVDYYNSRKRVVPSITTTAAIQISHNGNTYTLDGSGKHTITSIIFNQGINTLTFSGTATVSVEYQEGDL